MPEDRGPELMANTSPLLKEARDLLTYPSSETAGLWPRASALLTRQALESSLDELWYAVAPALSNCSLKAQFLCLGNFVGDERLGREAYSAWASLSWACHYHPYDLPPTVEELTAWIERVEELHASVRAMLEAGPRNVNS